MTDEILEFSLRYGRDGLWRGRVHPHRLLLSHSAPKAETAPRNSIRTALRHPLDFPTFAESIIPGDHVVIVLERDTPRAAEIISELWSSLQSTGISPNDVLLLQPADWRHREHSDPRRLLPKEAASRIRWQQHDPTTPDSCGYLAATAAGDAISLSRELLNADAVLTIGPLAFDSVLGVRGGASALYPGLSDVESLRKALGSGHDELGPDDPRPQRQKVDEIGWLLGLQMSIGVIPGDGDGLHAILAGQIDSVLRQGTAILHRKCLVNVEERAELVIVAIPEDAGGHGWEQVAAGFEAGRRLVERNGRIVVLSQLKEAPGPGLSLLPQFLEPRQALRPLRQAGSPDQEIAMRIAAAADWANLCLLSELPDNVLEPLFIQPIAAPTEVQRLLDEDPLTAILECGQQCWVQTGEGSSEDDS